MSGRSFPWPSFAERDGFKLGNILCIHCQKHGQMFCDYGYEKKVLKVETSWRTVKVILKIRFDI